MQTFSAWQVVALFFAAVAFVCLVHWLSSTVPRRRMRPEDADRIAEPRNGLFETQRALLEDAPHEPELNGATLISLIETIDATSKIAATMAKALSRRAGGEDARQVADSLLNLSATLRMANRRVLATIECHPDLSVPLLAVDQAILTRPIVAAAATVGRLSAEAGLEGAEAYSEYLRIQLQARVAPVAK